MPNHHQAHAKEIARLCRIKLTNEEVKTLEESLENILNYFDQIEEVDTADVEPCTTVLPTLKNVMAEDRQGDTLSRETYLKNAPEQVGGMIKVPPVILFEN